MAEPAIRRSWLPRTHHRMRTASFAMVFAATCLHIVGRAYGMNAWIFLVSILLIYPHLQYWRALKAADPVASEMRALLVDALLLGIFAATVEFSTWLSFSVALGTLSNSAANKGWRGIGAALPALLAGAALGALANDLRFSPQTDPPAALFCMFGLGTYVLAMIDMSYKRNLQLRLTRKELEAREKELLRAHETLQQNFAEIDALRKQLLEQANSDALTGLHNRRYLDTVLEREQAHCKREGKPLALLMIDIDHFKKFNDRYGHQAGDECLRAVARSLQASARRGSDLAARYGGEEFSLVLPDTDAEAAQRLAEALRRDIEALAIPHVHSGTKTVTISVGLAVMADGAYADAEALLRAADEALYYAKWGGRNQVQLAPDAPRRLALDADTLERLQRFDWSPSCASGHAEIDQQHRLLFTQVNTLIAAVAAGCPGKQIIALIDDLLRSVAQHFEEEEAVVGAAGCPNAAEHATGHRRLMKQAVDLVGRFHRGQVQLGELFEFLSDDLIANHFFEADRQLLPYLVLRPDESSSGVV